MTDSDNRIPRSIQGPTSVGTNGGMWLSSLHSMYLHGGFKTTTLGCTGTRGEAGRKFGILNVWVKSSS